MNHQDLKPLVFRKDIPKSATKTATKQYMKPRGDIINDEKGFKKIPLIFSRDLMQARQKNGLTQKELSQKLCNIGGHGVTTAIIAGYERGTIIPDCELINKMNRILDIKLPKCK